MDRSDYLKLLGFGKGVLYALPESLTVNKENLGIYMYQLTDKPDDLKKDEAITGAHVPFDHSAALYRVLYIEMNATVLQNVTTGRHVNLEDEDFLYFYLIGTLRGSDLQI